uniref:Serine carboxypeptidase-like 19 n=2 Tax=Aegilops tauschii subsp. strangulata TaxID=200361 RepID=A0A453MTL2_AEGTS
MVPYHGCGTILTHGPKLPASCSSTRPSAPGFPSPGIPQAIMLEKSLLRCSSKSSSPSGPLSIHITSQIISTSEETRPVERSFHFSRRRSQKGYLVGNPGTGESIDFESRVPFLHGMGIISDQLYETIMEHCHGEVYTNPKTALCAQASDRFDRLYDEIYRPHILFKKCVYASSGTNDGSIERKILKEEAGVLKHPPPRLPMDCHNYGTYLSYFWANNNITRDALGIKKGSKDEWVRCHEGDLPYSFDIKSTIKYHRNMTLKGYPALVYSGDHDSAVPFLGTQSWVRSLNFPIVDEWRAWHLDGQSAGFTITYTNNLTFATVKGGGHTAPEFQPERCLAMFRRWVCREPL